MYVEDNVVKVLLKYRIKRESNSKRFIEAFNQIDYAVRVQNGFKRSLGFSDMIRRASSFNHIIKKYEDDLIDFGRLRNAIVHSSNPDITIDRILGEFISNRKLLAIIITKTGTMREPPLAIITSTDYMELNKILENY